MPAVRTVMVVEDDRAIQCSMRLLFEHDGFEVMTAYNGREALDLLGCAPRRPSVIFLDLMMPIMDGFEFIQCLRASMPELAASLPVIVVTAAPLPKERIESLAPTVRKVVKKPFSIDEALELAETYCQ